MLQKGILICVGLLISQLAQAQDKTTYIELYKNVAMSEMMRTGIPASIKLAQAILESSCGKSDLACKANNHFGIKCGNDWKGKSYKKEDDDFEDGKLVKSCFREFSTVYDSYIAHSDFLTDPNKNHRYGFLFQLDATDYKGWAKGLSKAGYATDPQYSNRLIDIIEKNELYKFDAPLPDAYAAADKSKRTKSKSQTPTPSTVRYHNEVKYAVARAGDTPESFASRNDISAKQVMRYNDGITNENQVLTEGSKIYVQPKRNLNKGKQKFHLIKPGDDLITISQIYGIKLSALQKRNGLKDGQVPAPNQKLYLKGKNTSSLRTVSPYRSPKEIPEKENREVASNAPSTKAPPEVMKPSRIPKTETASVTIITSPLDMPAHTVSKGDTLYSLSRQYGITVAELKKMNNLSADTISIGQKLLLR